MASWDSEEFSTLLGRTLTSVQHDRDDEVVFHCADGTSWRLFHSQDCCECVVVHSVDGDFADLIGTGPLVMAESHESDSGDSVTWTFYKLATVRGYVTITWRGESNGYYSESVSFARLVDA